MRNTFVILPLLAGGLAWGATRSADPDRLRSLVALPQMEFRVSFGFTSRNGFVLGEEPFDPEKAGPAEERLKRLRAALTQGPDDGERYLEIAEVLGELGRKPEQEAALERAERLWRERLTAEPESGYAKSQLGRVLATQGRTEQGEVLLRSATEMSPRDWRCWSNLGRHLGSIAFRNASAIGQGNPLRTEGESSASLLDGQPEAALRARAIQAADEAKRCFDEAVAVAPEKAEPYLARAGYAAATLFLVRGLRDEPRDRESVQHPLLSPEVIGDLKAVAERDPENVGAIATAAFFQVVSATQDARVGFGSEGFWPSLPDDAREAVRDARRRLDDLSSSADANTASAALLARGALEFLMRLDMAAAERLLRRSIERDTRLDAPWELLCAICVGEERWEDAARVCEQRLRMKNSARLRLVLAKLRFRQGNEAEAEKQVAAALREDPKHRLARLSEVALRLRRAESPQALSEVAGRLRRLAEEWGDSMSPEERYELALLHAMGAGLAGRREEAVELLRALRDAKPDDQRCQKALAALGNL